MLSTTQSKRDRDLIIVPDQPARKASLEESSPSISFESENSSLSGNLGSSALPAPEYFAPLYEVTKIRPETSKLRYPNLVKMLGKFGEYPDKYRALIWRYLLALPLNKGAYEGLLRLGIHPAYGDLRKKYPIQSQRLFCRTQRILSALGHWAPFTCEIDYLPGFVFPFVKMIEHDDLVLFEVIVSILTHWCQNWFVAYPQPPVSLLQTVEDVLSHEDPELASHFRKLGFHPVQYAWPLLQTMFSEVMPKPHWTAVMDHVITSSGQPQFLFALVTAYLLQLRGSFITVTTSARLAISVRTMGPIDVKRLIKRAKELLPQMSGDKCPETYVNKLPISAPGQTAYPVLGGYPKYIVEVGSQIRLQVLAREQDILKQKHLVEELQKHNQKLLEQELRLRQQQEGALYSEKERAAQKLAETEVEVLERKSLANKEKAKRLGQIKELESKLGESLAAEDRLRKMHEDREACDYNQRKTLMRQENEERQELEELRNIEYKATEKAAELLRLRQTQDANRTYSNEQELRGVENETRDKQLEEKWRAQDQDNMLKRELWLREREAALAAERQEQMRVLQEKEAEIRRKERELEIEKTEHERTMRRAAEEQIYTAPAESKAGSSTMKDSAAAPREELRPGPADRYERAREETPLDMQRPQPQTRYGSAEPEAEAAGRASSSSKGYSNSNSRSGKEASTGGKQTMKMSVHETRDDQAATLNGPNTYSEPFTFKNTATATGISAGEIAQDVTKKMRSSDMFARPVAEEDKYVREAPHDSAAGFGRPTSSDYVPASSSLPHTKNLSYPTPALQTQPDLAARHSRVAQQLEEMQRRFGQQSAELSSEPASESRPGDNLSHSENGNEKSSSISSEGYSASSKNSRSPSGAGESPADKYGLSSGTSMSG